MRLIDADELKEQFAWSEICRLSITEINNIINDAPTCKPCENCDLYFKAMTKQEINKIEHKAYNEDFKDGVDQGIRLS